MDKRAPETVYISITRADGSLAVMCFVTKERPQIIDPVTGETSAGWEREPSAANINAEIAKARINAASWRIVPFNEIPTDRTFRGAWRDNGKVNVNMPLAREIQRERIRVARAPLFQALDAEYLAADERSDPNRKREIAIEKQRLRDFTNDPRIDAAQTPEELKAILP